MAGEQAQGQQGTPQETATVTTTSVTDEALSSAYDAGQSETGQQTEQTETQQQTEGQEDGQQAATGEGEQTGQQEGEQQGEQTEAGEHEEPADNAERSRLGRRLKTVEETNAKILSLLEQLQGAPAGQQQAAQQQQQAQPAQISGGEVYDKAYVRAQMDAAVERGEIPGTIMTPSDLLVVDEYKQRVEQDASRKYIIGYLNVLKSPALKGDTPDDVHAEVLAELQRIESPFNNKRFYNPQADAQTNYLEAKVAILQKRLAAAKPTGAFKGRPAGSPPTGTHVSTRTAAVTDDMPELDAASLDYIKRNNMSAESVKNALKGDMPLGLKGR